jgi:hypothetical protein
MKKAIALSIAAFYLLLTTGMFVCIIHCTAESLMPKQRMSMTHAGMDRHGPKKHCADDKDCGCCKRHGTYVIKENIKPGFEVKFAQTAIFLDKPLIVYHLRYSSNISGIYFIAGKAPPGKTGKMLSILYHSILI